MTENIKFKYGNDEFVNEASAEIANLLRSDGTVDVEVTGSTIIISCESPVNKLRSVLYNQLAPNTHRRSSIARYYQSRSMETDIPSSDKAFPDDHKLGESIDKDDMERAGIDNVQKNIKDNIGQKIYTLNPYYTGDPTNWKTKRLDLYLDALQNEFNSDYEADRHCRCCNRKDLPLWKYDGEDIEYNQQFTHHITKSGMTELGQRGSQSSNKRGRCVSCLIAGFAYTLIKKPFYTDDNGDYRIFSVNGTLDSIYEVRKSYQTVLTDVDSDVDEVDPRYKILSSNIPTRVRSDEGQLLSLLCRLLDSYTESVSDGMFSEPELVKRIDGITAFTSSNSKGGQPVRGITSMSRYKLFDDIYEYIKPVNYAYEESNQKVSENYRVGELIESLSTVEPEFGTGDRIIRSVDQFSNGILNENSSQIESGLFGVAKPVVNSAARIPTGSINILGASKYLEVSFQNMTELTNNEIEALSSVGSSFGGIFDSRDDVSVLISLKNSNNLEQLLESLERAGMEGMKKSMVRGEKIQGYDLIRNDDLEVCIKALSDSDKFNQAKNILVSHASLSALYNHSKQNSENGDTQ